MRNFFAKDAEGAQVQLPAGQPFTTYFQTLDGDEEAAEIIHAWNALDAYDEATLAKFGITFEDVDDPAPPRRLIPKSLVQERVNAIGKLADAFAALQSQPILFGRWFAPDWPRVYADDEGLLTLLNAIGCTSEEIDAITAP